MATDPFIEWLPEVLSDEVVVNCADILAEARGNLWSFALNPEQAAALSRNRVADFVGAVVEARGRWLSAHGASPMLFYCWYEEQASQLRLSLVSKTHGCLPFEFEVKQTSALGPIVASFLGSPQREAIPRSEESGIGPLSVWVVTTPSADDGA